MNPKRKLFLSWMAVREALVQGDVAEKDLRDCLFATSAGELILGHAFYSMMFNLIYPHLRAAAEEGRLVYCDKIEHLNNLSFACVNRLLESNGVAPLSASPSGMLSMLRHGLPVPTVSDSSLQVLWQDQPSGAEMTEARRSQDEEQRALIAAGGRPDFAYADWMSDIKLAIQSRV